MGVGGGREGGAQPPRSRCGQFFFVFLVVAKKRDPTVRGQRFEVFFELHVFF